MDDSSDDLAHLPPPPGNGPSEEELQANVQRAADNLRRTRLAMIGLAGFLVVVLVVFAGWQVWQRANKPSEAAKEACGQVWAGAVLFELAEGNSGLRETTARQMYNAAQLGLDADESIVRARARAVVTAANSGSGGSLNSALQAFLNTCEDLGL